MSEVTLTTYTITPVSFTSHQERLYIALLEIDESFGAAYKSALSVLTLSEEVNPGRIAQSAHSIREIMEKYALYARTDGQSKRKAKKNSGAANMGALVGELQAKWKTVLNDPFWKSTPQWDGPINKCLQAFLNLCESHFIKIAEIKPSLDDRAGAVFDKNNLHTLPIPDVLKNLKVEEWKAFWDYFVGTSHKMTGSPSLAEFENMLVHWEQFMINLLLPPVATANKKLLKMISEAEDANS